jgi:hypothetical protein
MIIIHITREIGYVLVHGANGSEGLIRELFHQQDVEDEIVRKSIESGYLSHERLEEYLSDMIRDILSIEEKVKVNVY